MYASSYPTMNYAAAPSSYPQQKHKEKFGNNNNNNHPQSPPPNETSLVPAVAPGYNVYGNYHVPPPVNSSSSSSNNDALLDDLMSFDVPPPPTFQSLNEARAFPGQPVEPNDAGGLRDDAFVSGLPPEIVREQERILEEIKRSNQNKNSNSVVGNSTSIVSNGTNSNYLAAQQEQLVAYSNSNNSLVPAPPSGPLPAEVHPLRHRMKAERRAKTAAAATTGAIVGGLISGPAWPIGAAAGAAVGGYACKVTARAGERRQQRSWERRNVNEYASRGVAGVQADDVVFA